MADIMLPLGVAGAVPYVTVILLTVWLPNKKYSIYAGILTTILTVIGIFLSQPKSDMWIVWTNRSIAVFGIWIAVITTIYYRKSRIELEELNLELEKRVEEGTEEIKESNHLHSLISRNFPNGTINVLDKNLNYIFAEGQEFFRYGITSEKLVGHNYIQRLAEEIRVPAREKLIEALKGKTTSFEVEYKESFYRLQATPLFDSRKGIERILVVEINITKEKATELELQKTIAKEQELNELKTRFVSMASHEFRAPLGTILSSTNLLKKYKEVEKYDRMDRHIKRIKSSVHNLTGILNDFLSIDKLESGNISHQIQEFNLNELLTEVKDDMQEQAKEGQIIHLSCESDLDTISLDPNLIKNILINLLSNAIKYSEKNKEIFIKATVDIKSVEIEVKDEGIGIPEEDQKHMFERFFRAGNSTNIGGTGLGLNIVNKYLQLMNGTINFESKHNEGTSFKVEIPLQG